MKRRRFKTPIALGLLLAAYLTATWLIINRAEPLGSDRPIKLRLAHWQLERGIPDGYEAIIKRYEELHPNVDVEQVIVPSTIYRQWLRSNLTGGTGADLIEYGAFLGNINDVPTRYFEPITELLAEPNPYNKGTPLEHVPWRLTFTDGLWGSRMANPDPGQLYAVTLSQGSMRLFCNRDLLRAITGSESVPQTLDEFRVVCGQIHDYARRTGRVLYPLAGSRDNALWLLTILMQTPVIGLNHQLDHEGFLNRSNARAMADYLAAVGLQPTGDPGVVGAGERAHHRDATGVSAAGSGRCGAGIRARRGRVHLHGHLGQGHRDGTVAPFPCRCCGCRNRQRRTHVTDLTSTGACWTAPRPRAPTSA
jgi:ABC-type glycerol-3-phosphate transport system substrate-binding protein